MTFNSIFSTSASHIVVCFSLPSLTQQSNGSALSNPWYMNTSAQNNTVWGFQKNSEQWLDNKRSRVHITWIPLFKMAQREDFRNTYFLLLLEDSVGYTLLTEQISQEEIHAKELWIFDRFLLHVHTTETSSLLEVFATHKSLFIKPYKKTHFKVCYFSSSPCWKHDLKALLTWGYFEMVKDMIHIHIRYKECFIAWKNKKKKKKRKKPPISIQEQNWGGKQKLWGFSLGLVTTHPPHQEPLPGESPQPWAEQSLSWVAAEHVEVASFCPSYAGNLRTSPNL